MVSLIGERQSCKHAQPITPLLFSRMNSSSLFRRLRYLDLGAKSSSPSGLTDHGLNSIMHLISVEELSLENNANVTFENLDSSLQSLPILYKLNLRNCTRIQESGIERLVECCPRLRDLDLRGCEQLSQVVRDRIWAKAQLTIRYARKRRDGWGFRPVPEATDYEYRDCYIERKLLEQECAHRIIHRFRLYK